MFHFTQTLCSEVCFFATGCSTPWLCSRHRTFHPKLVTFTHACAPFLFVFRCYRSLFVLSVFRNTVVTTRDTNSAPSREVKPQLSSQRKTVRCKNIPAKLFPGHTPNDPVSVTLQTLFTFTLFLGLHWHRTAR